MSNSKYISKSKYMLFLESPRKFWDSFHDKESLPPESTFDMALKAMGEEVDQLARSKYPGALDCLPEGMSFSDGLAFTEAAIKEARDTGVRRVLLQPSFMKDGLFARADILLPDKFGDYELLEVKAVSEPNKDNYQDVAFQAHVYAECGVPMSAIKILHLNKEYVRDGDLDVGQLFVESDVTDKAGALEGEVIENIAEARRVYASSVAPAVDVFDDGLLGISKDDIAHYAPHLLTPDSVFKFPGIHRDKALVMAQEIRAKKIADGSSDLTVRVSDLAEEPRNFKQTVFRQCAVKKQMYCEREVLREMLGQIKFPVTFLDFETLLHVVPKFDGGKPNDQVPFQVCAYRIEKPGADIVLHEHLADHRDLDTRRSVLTCVYDAVKGAETVIAYNASFELGCLARMESLADEMGYLPVIQGIKDKMVDVGKPFMAYKVYSHEQNGSGGLKSVSAALFADDPYKGKDVKGGAQASYLFAQMTLGNERHENIENVRNGLLEYCRQDVYGMIDLVAITEDLADIPQGQRRFVGCMQAQQKPFPPIVSELDTAVLLGRSKSPASGKSKPQIAY